MTVGITLSPIAMAVADTVVGTTWLPFDIAVLAATVCAAAAPGA